jgi:ABC-type transport system involved in multi-copper enzyme maturation permease subunit
MRRLWQNPVFQKEARLRLGLLIPHRMARRILFVSVCIFLLIFIYIILAGSVFIILKINQVEGDIYKSTFYFRLTEFLFGVFIVPYLAASAISKEKKQGTWVRLLESSQDAVQIVQGKFWGGLSPVALLIFFATPYNLVMIGSHKTGVTWQLVLYWAVGSLCVLAWFLALHAISLTLSYRFSGFVAGMATTLLALAWAIVPVYLKNLPNWVNLTAMVSPLMPLHTLYNDNDDWVDWRALLFLAIFLLPTLLIAGLLYRRLVRLVRRDWVETLAR